MKNSLFLFGVITFFACGQSGQKSMNVHGPVTKMNVKFISHSISNSAQLWWARTLGDVDGDGILDVILQDNNGAGGWLGFLKGRLDGELWDSVIVAERSPRGNPFAAGDLEVADIDLDGDIDLIAIEHPGEWTNSGAPAYIYWYEQTDAGWAPHEIGSIPSALKDICIADLNQDKIPEIITVTFDANTLSIFSKDESSVYSKIHDLKLFNLHEGLDAGDIDGDGWLDIAANGYWLQNPQDLRAAWGIHVIDSIWFNQEGDWSANATKTKCQDTDQDGKAEVFITHSERSGYPVVRYSWVGAGQPWEKEIIKDSLPAAHSLQVEDMDLDGTYEVLTGVNRNRAINLNVQVFPVIIFQKKDDQWSEQVINSDGVYNLLSGDLEGDGDIDLVRLTTHDGQDMSIMINQLK